MSEYGFRIYNEQGIESMNENDLMPKYILGKIYNVRLPQSTGVVEYRINIYGPDTDTSFPNVIGFPIEVQDDPPIISLYTRKGQLIMMPLPNRSGGIVPAGVYTFKVSWVNYV